MMFFQTSELQGHRTSDHGYIFGWEVELTVLANLRRACSPGGVERFQQQVSGSRGKELARSGYVSFVPGFSVLLR